MNAAKKSTAASDADANAARPKCGIVRPIAAMGEYSESHWAEVHAIIEEAAEVAGYEARLVSESESIGVIVGHIVSNLYHDEIVICDVSGKNPNVMFELGLRIAFQKPVIIVTDDLTGFSFDISAIKHIPYPSTLRYDAINKFKRDLASAIKATVAYNGPGYLAQFGNITVADLPDRELDTQMIVSSIQEMGQSIRSIEKRLSHSEDVVRYGRRLPPVSVSPPPGCDQSEFSHAVMNTISSMGRPHEIREIGDGSFKIYANSTGSTARDQRYRHELMDRLSTLGEVSL